MLLDYVILSTVRARHEGIAFTSSIYCGFHSDRGASSCWISMLVPLWAGVSGCCRPLVSATKASAWTRDAHLPLGHGMLRRASLAILFISGTFLRHGCWSDIAVSGQRTIGSVRLPLLRVRR